MHAVIREGALPISHGCCDACVEQFNAQADGDPLTAQIDRLTTMAAEQAEWIDAQEAAGVQNLRWPGGVDTNGEPLLNRTNDLAVFARIDARKPAWIPRRSE
jgi:hypothetical protein